MTDALIMLGLALAVVVIEMTVTWLVARKLNNYGIVDAVWAGGIVLIALLAFLLVLPNVVSLGPIGRLRPCVLTGMYAVWGVRLAGHLARRIANHHPVEDVRYAKLRQEWGNRTPAKMLWFFQAQGALQLVLLLPLGCTYLGAHVGSENYYLGLSGIAGAVIWFAGLLGESLADRQLARFRADPANKGKVCQSGLWNYSRHPNYFFEWLVWVGYAVFALGSPWGWLGIIAPALMLHFLLNVTGIPMTEEMSLKSKGDTYRAYQRTTSAFVPWFKKHAPIVPATVRTDFITKLTENTFEAFASNARVAVVLFDADWDIAGRATMLHKMRSAHEQHADSVAFGEVDADAEGELARKMGLTQLPTLIYYRNGQVLASVPNATQDVSAELAKILGERLPS